MSNLSLKFKLPFSYYSRSNLEELKPSKNGRQTILCKDSMACVINQIQAMVSSEGLSTWFFCVSWTFISAQPCKIKKLRTGWEFYPKKFSLLENSQRHKEFGADPNQNPIQHPRPRFSFCLYFCLFPFEFFFNSCLQSDSHLQFSFSLGENSTSLQPELDVLWRQVL